MTARPDPAALDDLSDYLRALLPDVARDTLAGVLGEVPDYRELPAETHGRDLPSAAEANLRLFLRTLAERRAPHPEELTGLVDIAVRRARAGISLDTVLSVYHHGALAAWNSVAAAATTPEQREQLLAAVPYVLRYLGAVTPGVAGAYLRERQDLHWEQREAERAVAEALVHGKPVHLLAERFGISLGGGFDVLAYRMAEPDSAGGHRPVLRIVQSEIDAVSGRALSTVERGGGLLLVPNGGEIGSALDTFVSRVAHATGVRTVAGFAAAAGVDDVPAAAEEASEIARLAYQLRRPTAVYRMADLALQYQLARPGPARTWLLSLLDPLRDQPHLLEALRALIDNDYNRQQAAAALVVHRNTLNYRLNRIGTVTGYDPNRPDHAQLFAAALTAGDIDATE
ncbi:CdaR family transcriptional regulator [Nocardia tenerifensis]|uniref:CdaR family transcriptional regulator n=1 Tax=Nocardia tenerifensis TaxID=228006 RepID=A0A318KUN3_9NOCA|nr:helix-turn-helix domain-containing protein [Nocardia tenerifensis]PXX68461.1 CdaR family transcriptional regulator [Nocardia tenerifensis]